MKHANDVVLTQQEITVFGYFDTLMVNVDVKLCMSEENPHTVFNTYV